MIYKLKDKYFLLSVIAIILFITLFVRLFKLQIVDSKMYLAKSESYLSSMERIPAPRGKILDRYGRPIVSNRLGFSVSFTKSGLSDDELNDLMRLNTSMIASLNLMKVADDMYNKSINIRE